ncbi:hypothetical protein ES705_45380 [subsurface metagenome]
MVIDVLFKPCVKQCGIYNLENCIFPPGCCVIGVLGHEQVGVIGHDDFVYQIIERHIYPVVTLCFLHVDRSHDQDGLCDCKSNQCDRRKQDYFYDMRFLHGKLNCDKYKDLPV